MVAEESEEEEEKETHRESRGKNRLRITRRAASYTNRLRTTSMRHGCQLVDWHRPDHRALPTSGFFGSFFETPCHLLFLLILLLRHPFCHRRPANCFCYSALSGRFQFFCLLRIPCPRHRADVRTIAEVSRYLSAGGFLCACRGRARPRNAGSVSGFFLSPVRRPAWPDNICAYLNSK